MYSYVSSQEEEEREKEEVAWAVEREFGSRLPRRVQGGGGGDCE